MEKVHYKKLFLRPGRKLESSRSRWERKYDVYVDEDAIERYDGKGEKKD